ncbi:aminoglycoside phosphotransferase [Rhodoferax lacus]|uniref:Aminoglycoside phosphotransferase n=1 Tax=Rhodoferax lacus TaxID=2184758 RepID=A0A3E1RCW3_9BURK|nr:phosphotransferase [Rhodoferax lacus]RFO96460.1 aminoglycoside phosphotransferase [Rhodoferax lacus]
MSQHIHAPSVKLSPATQATDGVLWSDAGRQSRFFQWLSGLPAELALQPDTLSPASADASFRRYLRIDSSRGSLVVMDAPPDKEDCKPFVQVDRLMQEAGLRVPEVLAWEEEQGFLLLSDLGANTLLQSMDLSAEPPLDQYMEAVDLLLQWQLASRPEVLPVYDQALLRRELELFPQWYIAQHRQVVLDEKQRKTLDEAFERILQNNLSWPSVYVHRDFMPRNLMVSPQGMGVLDFQDAVYGPITYDIASLMRDAFLSWDEAFCLDVTIRYWQKARRAGLPVGDDFGAFYQGVEWMGLQRHLKVAGIFARLTLRDGKPQYLADTPRFIHYIRSTCARYMALKPLLRLVETIEGIEVPTAFAFGRF